MQLAYSSPSIDAGWNPASNKDVLLGVVASDVRLGLRALRDWCQALQLPYVHPDCKVCLQFPVAVCICQSRIRAHGKHVTDCWLSYVVVCTIQMTGFHHYM